MNKGKNIVWGLVLIAIGIILAGNALDLFHVDVFFDGWWTLFIIVPSLFGIASEKDKTASCITLVVGVLLLLACQNIIDFDIIWKLIVPIIIIGIGLSLIFKNSFDKKLENIKKSDDEIFATFSGQDIKVEDEFKGTNVNAVFGGVKLDLTEAKIKNDCVINATAVFGGIDILVNDNVKVVVKSTSIFGGADNKNKEVNDNDKAKTIYVNATCIFGGVEIK